MPVDQASNACFCWPDKPTTPAQILVIQWKVSQPPKSWQFKALVVSMLPLKGLTAENRTATNTRGLAFTGKSMRPPRPRYVGDWKAAIVQGLTSGETEPTRKSASRHTWLAYSLRPM